MTILQCANQKGFSLLELLFAVAIFGLITLAMTEIFLNGFRWNTILWDGLIGQGDARRAVEQVVNDARRASASNTGGYAIELARDNEFIFFANVDNDTVRERVRYALLGNTLKKGITKPSGNPLAYTTSTETVVDIAYDVKNNALNRPVFVYYDAAFTGTQAPLATPASTTLVRAVRVQIDIDHNPDRSPVPLHVEGFVKLRNVR